MRLDCARWWVRHVCLKCVSILSQICLMCLVGMHVCAAEQKKDAPVRNRGKPYEEEGNRCDQVLA